MPFDVPRIVAPALISSVSRVSRRMAAYCRAAVFSAAPLSRYADSRHISPASLFSVSARFRSAAAAAGPRAPPQIASLPPTG